MKRNRLILSDDESVILEESKEEYFTYVDRDVDYAFTFHKDKIGKIVEFLNNIRGGF